MINNAPDVKRLTFLLIFIIRRFCNVYRVKFNLNRLILLIISAILLIRLINSLIFDLRECARASAQSRRAMNSESGENKINQLQHFSKSG